MNKKFSGGKDNETATLSRRACIKTLGAGVSLLAIESGTATATAYGYGVGGYGAGEYGDPSSSLTVTTDTASNVDETSATLNGSLTDLGGASAADVYFQYRQAAVTTWSSTAVQTVSLTDSFSVDLTGLSDGVGYEFRAVASTSDGDAVSGSTSEFTTVEDLISVSTTDAVDVDDTTATLTGSLTDLGNAESADVTFDYRTAGTSDWTSTAVQTLSSAGEFSASVSDLIDGTTYEFQATAEASDGDTAVGALVTFATDSAESDPIIESYTVTEAGSPNPHTEISAEWAVSDADGDLSVVTMSVSDATGTTVRSSETSVSGRSASGSEAFKIKHSDSESYTVLLRVGDNAGNGVEQTKSVSA